MYHPSGPVRSFVSRRPGFLIFLLLLTASVVRAQDAAPAAELILRGGATGENADPTLLSPTAAFELRFTAPMVAADQVGQPAAESPLVIAPPLPGAFRWTSGRGGVFTIAEPLPLGASYRVALRPDLQTADGQPVHTDLAQTFHTPPMEMRGVIVGRYTNGKPDGTPGPHLQLIFNSAVDPGEIAPALSFFPSAPDGTPVPAVVTPVTDKDYSPFGPALSNGTWHERSLAAHAAQTSASPDPAARNANRVFVSPATPLPPGKGWRLVARAGLRGTDPGAVLPAAVGIPAGDVASFAVLKVEAVNGGAEARKLVVRFSRGLGEEVTADTIGKWLRVSPEPDHIKFHVQARNRYEESQTVEITGDFDTDQDYEVTINAGMPSVDHAYQLAAGTTKTLQFIDETPQIAFADFSLQQLSSGRREFAFSARNAAQVRVRARLVPAAEAAQALIAYDKTYYNRREGGYAEGSRADFDHFPGKVVYDKIVPGSREEDKLETVTLRWDDLIGAGRNGVVLLEVEQTKPTAGQKKRAGAQALVQVTDLGVAWKTAPDGELLAYVFSMADAAPLKANVRLLDDKGHPLVNRREPTETTTRGDGVAWLAAGAEKAAWLAVTAGEDCHVVPFDKNQRNELSLYEFHLPPSSFAPDADATADNANANADADAADGGTPAAQKAAAPKPPRREMLLFTERGVYKPGEQAHVKAVVREWRGGGLADVPAGTPATLRAFDAKGRRFWQKDGTLSAAGSLDATIPLPTSTLGRYRVEISFDVKKAAAAGSASEDMEENEGESADADDDDGDADSDTVASNVCRFQVQDFQPNAFEVKLAKPAAPPVGPGTVPIPLTARYYMGKTLSHAKTVWSLKAVDTPFAPPGFDDYVFGNDDLDNRLEHKRGELELDGQGALSDKGELAIAPQIVLNTASPSPRRVRLQASVTDQDQQTVTTRAAFTVYSSDFYLGVRQMPDILRAGDALPLEVVAVGAADAQPRAEPVKVTAKLSRIDWHTNRVGNDAGDSDYDSHPDIIPVGTVDLTTTGVRRVGKTWEPAAEMDALQGKAVWSGGSAPINPDPSTNLLASGTTLLIPALTPKEAGEYVVEISTQDAAGRAVRTSTTFDVLGDKEADWAYRHASQLTLVSDKAEYHAGERATLLVKTPVSGRALVTVEREGVSRAFVTEVAKEHPAVQVPILPGDAPNVYVSVLLMRGAARSTHRIKEPEYRAGYCQLIVPKADTRLAVDVRPEQPAYQPGDDVAVQVDVTDEAHQPAPGAEVTLYAVDRGVLSLTGYTLPDPLKGFYRPRPLDVVTGLTLPSLFSEDPDDLNFNGDKGYASNKGYLVGGGGEEGRGDRLRENFVACAYWNAALVTDAQGRVSAHFPAPDNLTEFEVMAVVHEGGRAAGDERAPGRFGGGQGEFRINKPLMLEPALPRFGNVGDHLILRAVVHNQSPVAGEAQVNLDLDDKAAIDGADTEATRTRRVRLAAGESRAVEFPVVFTHTGEAQWMWHARLLGDGPQAPAWKDAVRSTLTVDHPTPRRAEVTSFRVSDGHAEDMLARINPELLEGEDGTVEVSISTTRLGELTDGVDALLHYPYGCVEQTTSSLMPWLALKDFHDALPELRHTPQQVDDAVAHGVNRLLGMQTESGGLAYWPGEEHRDPHPWGSAYGGLGLALAKRAGYFVPTANFNKLCTYLSDQLRSDKTATHDTYHEHTETDHCLALYALALAGKGERAYDEKYFARRDELSPEDRTLLALAIAEDKGSADMIRTLLQPGPRETESPEGWNSFASTSVLDGMRLLTWCNFRPQDPAVEDHMMQLLDSRSERGAWNTTQGNAWAVLAMAAYARDVERPGGTAAGTVTLGGRSQPFQIKGKLESFNCAFPLEAAGGGKEKLSLSNTGDGHLYVRAKVESRPRGGAALTAAPNNGLGGYVIRRRYEKLLDDGTRTSADKLTVGDRVLVSLEIEAPDRAQYIAVNDPLPAVLEAINPDFKTSGAGGNAPPDGTSWWVSDFRELRADRAVFFCDSLYAGHFHLQYLARVRAAGTATAPAAKIEEMYHPDHFAETAASSVSSKALD